MSLHPPPRAQAACVVVGRDSMSRPCFATPNGGNALKIHRAAAVALMAILAVGSLGTTAAAQGNQSFETRADFVYNLDVKLGIQPIYPVFADFSDVSPDNPYYGYIEAAYRYGITDGMSPGVFGPELPVTRAEAAKYEVTAFGAGQAAQAVTSTNFTDNAQIPQALVGYVGEAVALGLMRGFPDNTFRPNDNLTVTQETMLLGQLQAAVASAKPQVTASPSDAAVNQQVSLSMTGSKNFAGAITVQVTGANASSAVISGSQFVATAPGTYTVAATVDGIASSTTITVYGAAAGLKISAPSSVVANGVSQSKVTVSVVDQAGNTVADNSDTIALYTDSNAAGCVLNVLSACAPAGAGSPAEAVAQSGVATFELQSGTVAGATLGLTTADASTAAIPTATASVTAAAQVATSFSVSAEGKYLTANSSGYTDTFDVQALDQSGSPMLGGAYAFSAAVSGPATFAGGSLSAQSGVYIGDGAAGASAPVTHVTVDDLVGQTGTVTLTVSGTGLTSASATATAVITAAPSQIVLSAAGTTNSDTPVSYTAMIEDSHGYPVDWTGTVQLTGSDSGSPGVQFSPSASLQFAGSDSAAFTAQDVTAGSYTITAADIQGALTSGTQTLKVTAGVPYTGAISPTTPTCGALQCTELSYVPLTNPTWTESVQIYDDHGNPVPEAGVVVDFTLNPVGPPLGAMPGVAANLGLGTINGVSEPAANASVTVPAVTNAQGVATAAMSGMAINEEDYNVTATIPSTGTFLQGAYVELLDLAANGPVTVSYTDPSGAPAYGFTADGTVYTGTFTLQNPQGIGSFTQDVVRVTESGTGSVRILPGPLGSVIDNPDGSFSIVTALDANSQYAAAFQLQAVRAGSVTLTYQDMNQLTAQPTSVTFPVRTGLSVAQVGFSSANGTAITASSKLSVPAGAEVPITVTTEDLEGNPINSLGAVAVGLSVTGGPGEIRLSETGADLSPQSLQLAPGQSTFTFYYLNDTSSAQSISFEHSVVLISEGAYEPVAAGATEPLNFYVVNGDGTAGSGIVDFTVSHGPGSVQPSSQSVGLNGTVSTVYEAPAGGWQQGSSATAEATIGGLSVDVEVTGK